MAKQTKQQTVQVNTTGGAVRISHPSSKRGKSSARDKAEVVVDIVTPKAVDGFIEFLRQYAVVGLAVGLVIGSQLKIVVDTLTNAFINPIFILVFDAGSLNTQTLTINWHGRSADIGWGAVAYQIINFIFIMTVVYVIIKLFKLDKLDKKKEPAK